jgi:hypothetical protein
VGQQVIKNVLRGEREAEGRDMERRGKGRRRWEKEEMEERFCERRRGKVGGKDGR